MPPRKVKKDDDDYVPDNDPSDNEDTPAARRAARSRRARFARGPTLDYELDLEDLLPTTDTLAEPRSRPPRARNARFARGPSPTLRDELEDLLATTDTPAEASHRPAMESGNSDGDASGTLVHRRSRYYRRIVLNDDDVDDEDRAEDEYEDDNEDKGEDQTKDKSQDKGKVKDEDVGDTPPTNLPMCPRRGPGPSSNPTTPASRPRPAPAPENTPRSAVAPTGPTHMVTVRGPEGSDTESEILSRISPGEVGVSSTSTSQGPSSSRNVPAPPRPNRGPSITRLPPAIGRGGAPPPWPAVPGLAENQFDYIRQQFEPILNTLHRRSFITIERREHSNRDVRLDGAGPEDPGRDMGNLQFNIRIWRPRGNCGGHCQDCIAEYRRFGVPRWGALPRDVGRLPQRQQAIRPRETTEQSENDDDSNGDDENESENDNEGKGRFGGNKKGR